ncbi:Uncharacterized protein MK0304 [Methanopyrus kandleri AV19]|uniref:Uncharacterized protein n=1 Tax=Methanopyrus kandleri (strain AV19 / DSM 6324 / JCM 9639 / NBRC 100938) TaxID=190192 RepID=Q8TYJ3_METKA|nr:Uncharacterized protein MK0304 [Methanopyrus kandleri AV19]
MEITHGRPYDEGSGWHEIFIDPTGPMMHKPWKIRDSVVLVPKHKPMNDDEYACASSQRPYDMLSEAVRDAISRFVSPETMERLKIAWDGLKGLSIGLMMERFIYTNFLTAQGVSKLIDKLFFGGNLEFEIGNWFDRVRRFPGWDASEDGVERRWRAFKSEWARWRVKEREPKKSPTIWVIILAGSLAPLAWFRGARGVIR